jgi:hypothetical protein
MYKYARWSVNHTARDIERHVHKGHSVFSHLWNSSAKDEDSCDTQSNSSVLYRNSAASKLGDGKCSVQFGEDSYVIYPTSPSWKGVYSTKIVGYAEEVQAVRSSIHIAPSSKQSFY